MRCNHTRAMCQKMFEKVLRIADTYQYDVTLF